MNKTLLLVPLSLLAAACTEPVDARTCVRNSDCGSVEACIDGTCIVLDTTPPAAEGEGEGEGEPVLPPPQLAPDLAPRIVAHDVVSGAALQRGATLRAAVRLGRPTATLHGRTLTVEQR